METGGLYKGKGEGSIESAQSSVPMGSRGAYRLCERPVDLYTSVTHIVRLSDW